MARLILLDAGVLGYVTHPRAGAEVTGWFRALVDDSDTEIRIPEIADYELRRSYLRGGFKSSIDRLDEFNEALGYIPITTETMRQAAEFWAEARQAGRQTAPDAALDCDMILAAQAKLATWGDVETVIATDNVGHLGAFADARVWQEIPVPDRN